MTVAAEGISARSSPLGAIAATSASIAVPVVLCVIAFGVDALGWFKGGVAIVAALGFAVLATALLYRTWATAGPGAALLGRVVCAGAIFVICLTRGAPHNNPLLYAAFEKGGPVWLAGLTGTILALGIAAGLVLGRRAGVASWLERNFVVGITLLAVCGALGAADAILAAWDQPSWSDASAYDRYAHMIALGQLPAGASEYMPVYQFGSAALFWTFGHFHFLPQLLNLLLAPVTVVALALATRRLFAAPVAGLIAGLLAMSHDYLRFTPHMMTIENWYVPAVAVALYCAARYLKAPSPRAVVLLALAVGLVFGIRLQGAFFCAFLLLAPLFVVGTGFRERLRDALLAGLVFAAVLLPWTVRNAVVDGNFSPGTAAKSARQMALTGDRRVFYGIRRGEATRQIRKEWEARYPDEGERLRAQAIHGWLRPFTDPRFVWLEAVPWRFLAFYGLLPPGVWDPGGVRATDWPREGPAYVLRAGPAYLVLLASLIGLLYARPRRIALFLLGGIGANLAIIIFAGFSEPRVSYPVLPLHMMLAAAPFAFMRRATGGTARDTAQPELQWRQVTVAVIGIALLAVSVAGARSAWGTRYALRPLSDGIRTSPDVGIDHRLPDVTCGLPAALTADGNAAGAAPKVRLRAVITGHHYPVKYLAPTIDRPDSVVAGFPRFTVDPYRETYHLAVLKDAACPEGGEGLRITALGVAIRGALADRPLQEADEVELEGRLKALRRSGEGTRAWVHADKMRLLARSGRLDW